MQPQLKSKVRCTDREIGEVTKVIVDPLSREISHIVVSMNGSGERQVTAFRHGAHTVWGLTERVLRQFLDYLDGTA